MKRRRVKITGIGPVTPAGIGREAFESGIFEMVSRIRPFTKLGDEFGPFVAGFIDRFRLEEYVDRNAIPKGAARHTQFAAAGALLALRDASIDVDSLSDIACAIVAGSSLMDFDGIGRTIKGVISKGMRGAVPRTVYTTNAACIPATIAELLCLQAKTLSIQTSCCAGLDAVGHAARMVAEGEVDIAICGGSEAPLFQCPLIELRATGLTPSTTDTPKRLNRPFDLWRTTGVVSEGACMFVIEPDSSPRRGYAYVSGYAYAGDPRGNVCFGLQEAIKHAIADASIKPEQIDAVNAWGPGHRVIDAAESAMLHEVFGGRIANIPTVSIKGALGNALGAAPAMQIASAAISLQRSRLPPTVNWQYPDPACALNLSASPRDITHDMVLVNSHGLSGLNACLVMQRCC